MFAKKKRFKQSGVVIVLFSAIFFLASIIRNMILLKKPAGLVIGDIRGNFQTIRTDICSFPQLDPFDPAIMPFITKHPPLSCKHGKPSVVYLEDNVLKVNRRKVSIFFPHWTFVGCRYSNIQMKANTDFEAVASKASEMFRDEIKLNQEDENLVIDCYGRKNNKNTLMTRSYQYAVQLRKNVESRCEMSYLKHQKQFSPKETLSVILLGTDATSKQNFERAMPKARNYLLTKMQAMQFNKFNTVGNSTFPNMMALLTGKDSFSDFKREWKEPQPFDAIDYAFVWNEFRRAGYRTSATVGDMRKVTAFHWASSGWHKRYVDYNSRPMVVTSDNDYKVRSNQGSCVGDQTEVELLTDQPLQLMRLFNNKSKPYLSYTFLARLPHDEQNLLSKADDIYVDLLTRFHHSQALNNTVIFFFSDHGPRFGQFMNTFNGAMEKKMPYLFIIFPSWFYKKYPDIYNTLKVNQNRLTTFFDVHATLRDLVYFKGLTGKGDITKRGITKRDITKRGISLFKEIPEQRTCGQAGIRVSDCACVRLVKSNNNISLAAIHYFAEMLVTKVRSLYDNTLCEELYIDQVVELYEVQSQNRGAEEREFIVSIKTRPGGAVYQGKIIHRDNRASVEGAVDRLNLYRGQADCIFARYKKPFCFCKKDKK